MKHIEEVAVEEAAVEEVAVEESVLTELARIKRELVKIGESSVCAEYAQICEQYAARLQALNAAHKQRKAERNRRRSFYNQSENQFEDEAIQSALTRLKQESQRDSAERRDLKRERAIAVEPFERSVAENERRVRSLKQRYAQLSREWQMQMQAAYLAELADREVEPLTVLYEDADLVVVDKPAGLLSVPGRRQHLQDSVVGRLRYQRFGQTFRQTFGPEPKETFLRAVHRLDRDTSGVMAIALSPSAHASLSQQFAQRRVRKVYEAILSRPVIQKSGTISLPLCGCAQQRPKQVVNRGKGKPSRTDFKVLIGGAQPRVELAPHTGRTHQLRVHVSHVEGLNSPILGDFLYGGDSAESLCLHARELSFVHPESGESIQLSAELPF